MEKEKRKKENKLHIMKPYIILILLVAIAYANSLQNEFVWDDNTLIVENPKIDLSLRELHSVFTNPLWVMKEQVQQVYYRPMLSLLFILNYKIWGLYPTGFHLTNILLHLISMIVLYRIGLFLFNNDKLTSLIGASLFAVHPVNNEPLGRATSGDVIFGFFIILSIYFFLKERKHLSYLAFLLALFSKETAVMLPFALVILSTHKNLSHYVLKRDGIKKGIIEIIPYPVLIGIYLIIRALVLDTVLGKIPPQIISARILTMITAAFDYIRLLLIPYPLNPFYPARWHTSIFEPKVVVAIVILSLISFLVFKIRKDRIMLFLLLFPLIMLAPVIWMVNTFPVGVDLVFIAERFLYAPAMMSSLFISTSVIRLFGENKRKYIIKGWILTMVIFIFITTSANRIWKNDAALFEKIVKESPNAVFAHNNLGLAYAKQGQHDMAIEDFNKAIALDPNYAESYNNRGIAYANKGQYDKAIEDFNRVLALNPNDALAYNNRGNVYNNKGHYDKAIEDYNKAIILDPNDAKAHYNRGITYANKSQYDKAIEDFNRVLALNPNDALAYNNRGLAYSIKGNINKATSDFQKACDMGSAIGCENLQEVLQKR